MFDKLKLFKRWHPKIALRYLPVVDEINSQAQKGDNVLEIGSGSLGMVPYYGKEVTGVDTDFSGPQIELLKKVKADGARVPFEDNSFDFVVAVDVLEHIPPNHRANVIKEALRLARKEVIIGVPVGKLSEAQDKELYTHYEKVYGKPFHFLIEHTTYGLPTVEQIKEWTTREATLLKKDIKIKVEGNINMEVRKFLMYGWMTKNPVIDIIFRKVFLLFIPVLRLCNQEPTYRKLFFIKVK